MVVMASVVHASVPSTGMMLVSAREVTLRCVADLTSCIQLPPSGPRALPRPVPGPESIPHTLPRSMSSVVVKPDVKGKFATLGTAFPLCNVTPPGNVAADCGGGVDVGAEHDPNVQSVTPTTSPNLPFLHLGGRVGGVGAVAKFERETRSAPPTPSNPSAVDVAADIDGSKSSATPTTLMPTPPLPDSCPQGSSLALLVLVLVHLLVRRWEEAHARAKTQAIPMDG